jgi:hypothetical protein
MLSADNPSPKGCSQCKCYGYVSLPACTNKNTGFARAASDSEFDIKIGGRTYYMPYPVHRVILRVNIRQSVYQCQIGRF